MSRKVIWICVGLLACASGVWGQQEKPPQPAAVPAGRVKPPVNPEFIALPRVSAEIKPVVYKNLPYLQASGETEFLDIYQQPGEGQSPVVIYFHGGAWWKNARPESADSFQMLLSLGYSLVTVDYRLTDVAPAPAAVQDARCALSWVGRHASEYHFDPKRILVFGASSGGHQALMSAFLPEHSGIDLPECSSPPRPAAVLDFYGISDVEELLQPGITLTRSTTRWIGNMPDPHAYARTMSPLTYLRAGLPPVFLVHGDADPVVPYEQSIRLRDGLKKVGVSAELFTVPGGVHGKFTEEQNGAIGKALVHFLEVENLLPSPARKAKDVTK